MLLETNGNKAYYIDNDHLTTTFFSSDLEESP
jgi:hypothetical protein